VHVLQHASVPRTERARRAHHGNRRPAAAGDEASAPFMTRPESATRSVTQVRVDGSRGVASLVWWPRRGLAAIDPATPGASFDLELAASVAVTAGGGRA